MTEREKIAHLLRRFGLGASEAEVEYYGKDGLKGAIDKLLNYESTPNNFEIDPAAFANKQGVINLRVMQALWYFRMLSTYRPLEEKLALFWHNHFATSAQKVDSAYAMAGQIELFRTYGLGKFSDLLQAVSKDPAMIYWLDNHENVPGKPNENFAREVMELFTLGIGHYGEKDVQEAARAFTGWTYGNFRRVANAEQAAAPRRVDRFRFVASNHDTGEKVVLGEKGPFSGEEVLAILCKQPQTAVFLTKKLWEWFAHPEPEAKLIDRLATKYRQSDLDMKVLLRAVMESDEFYSEKSARKLIKHPIDFAVTTVRQLGAGEITMERAKAAIENPVINEQTGLNVNLVRSIAPCFATLQSTKSMGLELFYPPDVSGWRTGSYWITTSTMVERIKWAERLFAGGAPAGRANIGGDVGGARGGPAIGVDAMGLFAQNPTPEGAVEKLLSVFDAPASVAGKKTMIEAAKKASGGTITRANANDVARAVCKLIFGSPEFQFA